MNLVSAAFVLLASASPEWGTTTAFAPHQSQHAPRSMFGRPFQSSSSSPSLWSTSLTTATMSEVGGVEVQIGKPTGTSFLPEETVERARKGNPIEKIKLQKDGTAAFVDVYEYARKIREGKMSWEEVEKADLDSVRCRFAASRLRTNLRKRSQISMFSRD